MRKITPDPVDRSFRQALGRFVTGVAIVTTAHQGIRVGLTINSFSAVGLRPPLVLWSLANQANCMPLFRRSGHFAIHVLSSNQLELGKRFAAPVADRFAGVECSAGIAGLPLVPDCCARFQCRTAYEYEGGDHTIFVGEVLEFESGRQDPLIFHLGQFNSAWSSVTDASYPPPSPIGGDALHWTFSL